MASLGDIASVNHSDKIPPLIPDASYHLAVRDNPVSHVGDEHGGGQGPEAPWMAYKRQTIFFLPE